MAQKVTSNDIRIYPMSARGSATNQYGTNFMSEYNISTIPRQLLGSEGFVITSELPSKVNNEWQDIDYFEFNIYGYYVKVKLSAIETAINGTKGDGDDSDDYVEDFVWFTIDLKNNIVYANIRVLEATEDETYTVLCGSDSTTYQSDNIYGTDEDENENENTYTLVSLPILTATGSGTNKYTINGIYKGSCLNLINLNGINITTNSGELEITESSITQRNGNFTLNSDTINLNGDTNTTGNTTISKDVTINGSTTIGGSTEINGNTSINRNLDVKENITVENQLYVRKDEIDTDDNGETTITSGVTNEIGSSINPIYMNDGTFIPSSETVGSVSKPVYLNSGTIEEASNIYAGKTIKIGDGASTQTSENSYALHSIAIGNNATANGSYSIAIGDEAKAYYANSIAIGKGASPANENDIALGTQTVGNTAQPIYLNKGIVTASTGSIGNSITPIYMDGGILTASTGNVGSGTNPVYLSSGVITKSSSNKGTEVQANNNTDGTFTPIYLNNGELTTTTTTIGSTAQPIYMDNGTFTSTNATIGSATQPIYMDNGMLKETDATFDEPETISCNLYYSNNNFTSTFGEIASSYYSVYEVGLGSVKLAVITLKSGGYYNSQGDNIYVADFGENATVYGAWWMPVTHDASGYGNYDYGAYVTTSFSTSSGAYEATTSVDGRYAVWWSDQMSTSTRGAKFYAIIKQLNEE